MRVGRRALFVAGAIVAWGLACSSSPPSIEGPVADGGADDATIGPADDASADRDAPEPADSGTRGDADGGAPDGGADAAIAPFCRAGDDSCLARLDVGGMTLPYYRSHPLGTPNAALRDLVLIVHGVSRNADAYFTTMAGLAYARDPSRFLVVAPRIQALPTGATPCAGGVDAPAPTDLYWSCGGWLDGNKATNAATTSYAALDALVAAAKAAFPSITRVTIVGYSAGGQTVQRMASGSVEEDATPAVQTRWVVASPSSYLYFGPERLAADASCADAATCALDGTSFVAPYFDAAACPGYDDYKYGMTARTGMLKGIADATLRARYVSRKVTYVVGEGDSDASALAKYGELDKGCEADAEGPASASFRLQRGLTYFHYATDVLGATHRLAVVPLVVNGSPCGHDQACFFASTVAQTEVFGP